MDIVCRMLIKLIVIIFSYSRLKSLDPIYASSLMPNDWYRLKRALEICTISGRYI